MATDLNGMPQQLALRFPLRQDATFGNFVEDATATVVAQLRLFLEQPSENFLYLWGPGGAGLSHLLQAACHAVEEAGDSAIYMPLGALGESIVDALEGLEQYGLICLDELEQVAGNPDAEQAIFHCFNRARDSRAKLIIAGHQPVRGLGLQLPDLESRLQWGMTLHVTAPGDNVKTQVLRQRAAERGFELPEDVASFIMKRSERSLGQLLDILERLDRASLSAQRKLTVPFVKQTLGW